VDFYEKSEKKFFLAAQIEKTEINILQKEWGEKLFYFLRYKRITN